MNNCKPILENFVNVYDNKSESREKEGATKSDNPSDIYRPMHINPVFYDGDSSNRNKKVSREKRRAAKWLLEDPDLNEEEDLPVEIYYGASHNDTKFLAKLREREKYEEENFTRVPLKKRERLLQVRLERGEFLDTKTRMDHIRKLLESSDDEEETNLIYPKNKKKQKKNKRWKGRRKNGKHR